MSLAGSTPKAYSSQSTTTTTTETLRIFLIFASIGTYVLIAQRMTPTTTRISINEISDIIFLSGADGYRSNVDRS